MNGGSLPSPFGSHVLQSSLSASAGWESATPFSSLDAYANSAPALAALQLLEQQHALALPLQAPLSISTAADWSANSAAANESLQLPSVASSLTQPFQLPLGRVSPPHNGLQLQLPALVVDSWSGGERSASPPRRHDSSAGSSAHPFLFARPPQPGNALLGAMHMHMHQHALANQVVTGSLAGAGFGRVSPNALQLLHSPLAGHAPMASVSPPAPRSTPTSEFQLTHGESAGPSVDGTDFLARVSQAERLRSSSNSMMQLSPPPPLITQAEPIA